MKTLFKSFALIAIAALSLAACSKKEAPINENEMITLKFNIKNADDATTRALLGTDDSGNRFLDWEDGDKIGSFAVGTFGNYTTSNNNAGTVEVNGDDFTLNIQTFNSGTVTKIYSYFPFSSSAGKEKTAAVMTIPATQYITADGFDADAMPMAGTPISVNLATEANTDKPCGTINFSNLGSIINFKIYSSDNTDETLTSVKYVTSSGKLGGSYTIDLTAIDSADENTLTLGGNGTESAITTILQSNPAIGIGKSNAIDVYMVVAPGTYSDTQVIVTTSAKTYTLNASGEKTFVRSHVKPMYVNIKNGNEGELPQEETWVKVTSVSDFTAGTYYIVNWDEKKYLPNTEAGNAPSAKDFMGTITDDMKWEATVSDGGLIFKNPNSELYLWGQDGTNNGVRVKKTAPANTSKNVWKFTTNNSFGVIASVGETRFLATYNNAGTQQDWRNYQISSLGDGTNVNPNGDDNYVNNFPAVFYKLKDNRAESNLAWSATTGTADLKAGVAASLPSLSNPNNLTVTYTSSDPSVATVDATVHSITALKEGTTEIHAIFGGNSTYKPADVFYTLTVNDTRETTPTPTFSVPEGEVESGTSVTISCSDPNATIYYTVDGTTPSNASTEYSTAIVISANTTIKAIAIREGYKPSAIASADYTIQGSFAPVTFSWTQGGGASSGYTFTMENGANKSGYVQDYSTGLDLKLTKTDNSALFNTSPSTITLTVKVGGGSVKNPLGNNVIAYMIDNEGNNITSTETVVTTKVETKEGKEYTVSIPLVSESYGVRISHVKETNYNVRIYSISFTAE